MKNNSLIIASKSTKSRSMAFAFVFVVSSLLSTIYHLPIKLIHSYLNTTNSLRDINFRFQGSIWRGRIEAQSKLSSAKEKFDTLLELNFVNKNNLSSEGILLPRLTLTNPINGNEFLEIQVLNLFVDRKFLLKAFNYPLKLDLLQSLGTPWNTLQLSSASKINSSGFLMQVSKNQIIADGSVNIKIDRLTTPMSTHNPVGTYEISISAAQANKLSLTIGTLEGPLDISGNGHIETNKVEFNGIAKISDAYQESLGNLLYLIGTKNNLESKIRLSI